MVVPLICPYETVILAAGDFPVREESLSLLRKAREIICCDSAAEHLLSAGLEPHHIVGDMDSLAPSVRQRYQSRIRYFPEQETGDLAKALRFCMSLNRNGIHVMGIGGKREDHILANLSVLFAYSQYLELQAITNYGVFHPIRQATIFESAPKQQVSVFSMIPGTLFTYHGLKYPLKDATLAEWWQGALNEACGPLFTIEIHGGGALVFREFMPK
ncbi:MAG: thiamine diphosphokinase [Bacteroidales bacterium]|jgi:thiamine pyrophosphokinase|nr:thiamine diphosphokinase [Bacteroidales bacterium]